MEDNQIFKKMNFEDIYYAIDDIDGSNNLRIGRGLLPYASMIVSFTKSPDSNKTYLYSDYKEAACLDYLNKRIYYTCKGLGSVEIYDYDLNLLDSSVKRNEENKNLVLSLSTDIVSSSRGGTLGYATINEEGMRKDIIYPDELALVKMKYALCDSASSVEEYGMVGIGVRDGYISSGKKQHELPLLYAFANETGLEMTDFEGKNYSNKEYDFNGIEAEVIAATSKVRKDIQDLIEQQRETNRKLSIIFQAKFKK